MRYHSLSQYGDPNARPLGSGGWIWFFIAIVGGICAGIKALVRHPGAAIPVVILVAILVLIIVAVVKTSIPASGTTVRKPPPDLRWAPQPPGYDQYIASPHWALKRRQRLQLDGYRCQGCYSGTGLHVHHVSYDRLGHEDMADLITACGSCHRKIHSLQRKSGMPLPEATWRVLSRIRPDLRVAGQFGGEWRERTGTKTRTAGAVRPSAGAAQALPRQTSCAPWSWRSSPGKTRRQQTGISSLMSSARSTGTSMLTSAGSGMISGLWSQPRRMAMRVNSR